MFPISLHSCFRPCSPAPLSTPDPAICCNSGIGADIPLNKNKFLSKSAACVIKLATVLLPAETTGDAIGMIQHAAVPVWAVWLHLEPQTKTMQFPSYNVEESWWPSPPSKGNFFHFLPQVWYTKQTCKQYVLAAESKHVGQMGRSNTERGSVMKIHIYAC